MRSPHIHSKCDSAVIHFNMSPSTIIVYTGCLQGCVLLIPTFAPYWEVTSYRHGNHCYISCCLTSYCILNLNKKFRVTLVMLALGTYYLSFERNKGYFAGAQMSSMYCLCMCCLVSLDYSNFCIRTQLSRVRKKVRPWHPELHVSWCAVRQFGT